MRIGRELTPEQIEELEAAFNNKEFTNFHKRIQAVLLRGKKYSRQEIADITGLGLVSISLLVKKYVENGLEALTTDRRTTNNRYMTFEEEENFLKPFINKAANGEIIAVNTMHAAYQEAVGKRTDKAGFYRLLARHGWRKPTPRLRHPKQTNSQEQEIEK